MFIMAKVVSAQAVSSGAFNTRGFGGACGCSKLARGRRDAQGLEEGNTWACKSLAHPAHGHCSCLGSDVGM
jgi:hypothetical protein